VRAKISHHSKNTLVITEIPFSTTTQSLIDSILKANDKGKIKIKKIEDNTAAKVEILVHLPSGISPDKTIDALYAFTNCETSISPLGCVIEDNKPLFIGVTEMLRRSTDNTVQLLKSELEIKLGELEEQWHFASLERIFIENRIYRDIEEEETWDGVISAIDKGLQSHIKHLKRKITVEDITRLTEIRIKRISKFDIDKAQQKIDALEAQITEVKHHLANLIDYAIAYFTRLKKDYGEGKERKTEIRIFDDVDASKVVIRNTKLYVNREEGFIGTALRRDEYVCDCSDIDDIIAFTADGKMMVTKVDSKTFIGKNIIHVAVFKKKDKRTIYNLIYRDGKSGPSYVKRFAVTSMTRDREYDLTNGSKASKLWYFSANPNGEAEVVSISLRQVGSIKKLKWDLDFSDILIKARTSKGNLVTKYSIKRIELKEKGVSTLKPRKIWFDDTVQRLNVDERGELIGEFRGEDRLLVINQKGIVKTIIPELTTHFDSDMIVLEKWIPKKPISAIYYDGDKERYYVKRFLIEQEGKEESFISDHASSQLEIVSTDWRPMADVEFTKERGKDRKQNMEVNLEEFIAVKGINALGNQLTKDKINQINLLEPLPFEAPEEVYADELEVVDEEQVTAEVSGTTEAEVKVDLDPKPKTDTPKPKEDTEENPDVDDSGQASLF
jgi:topoisomerase-4 subunit A